MLSYYFKISTQFFFCFFPSFFLSLIKIRKKILVCTRLTTPTASLHVSLSSSLKTNRYVIHKREEKKHHLTKFYRKHVQYTIRRLVRQDTYQKTWSKNRENVVALWNPIFCKFRRIFMVWWSSMNKKFNSHGVRYEAKLYEKEILITRMSFMWSELYTTRAVDGEISFFYKTWCR